MVNLFRRMNVANKVTVTRLFVTIALLSIISTVEAGTWPSSRSTGFQITFALFFIVAITDALDGYLARKMEIETAFGRILDTTVDKIVVIGTMVFLVLIPESRAFLSPGMVMVVLGREISVTSIKAWMEGQGVAFSAEKHGKYKFVLQTVAISGLLFHLASGSSPPWFSWLLHWEIRIMVGVTFYSGWLYFRKAIKGMKNLPI